MEPMDDPEVWRWAWLVAAVAFGLGEMASAGSFFLAPFAAAAVVAAVLAFAGADVTIEWLAFLVVSVGAFAAMRPLARRLDRDQPTEGIGSKRLIGQIGVVLDALPGDHDLGLVRIHREEWRAESTTGDPVPVGARVRVVDIRGTRVVVHPEPEPSPPDPPPLGSGQPKEH
jgi:membrane protein implicated in regulation of membrane protease activity